jgi:Protein of unknown function (DUF2752)
MTPRGEARRPRLGAKTRGGMVALAAFLASLLAVARGLEPDPKGYGTHTRLGLPPCHFAAVTGTPCPSCGMTTAYAWFVRGRLGRSLASNPAGTFLAAASLVVVPWLLVCATLARTPGFRSPEQPLMGLVVAVVALSVVSWTVRRILG